MSVNAYFYSVVLLLRQLVEQGQCTKNEATRVAARIAEQTGVEVSFSL